MSDTCADNAGAGAPRRWVLWGATALTVAFAAGLALLADRMKPIGQGDPRDFWVATWLVDIESGDEGGWSLGESIKVGDRWVFERSHLHGSDLYSVSESEVEATVDAAVVAILESVPGDEPEFWMSIAAERIDEEERAGRKLTVAGLKSIQIEAVREQLANQSPDSIAYNGVERYFFEERVAQADRYVFNLVFEWVWLSGLVWFVAIPVIRRRALWRVAVRVAVVPFLLMLPVYLGYAQWTFTSTGVSGGVLYPWVVALLPWRLYFEIDTTIREAVPLILSPLSQGIGSPAVISGRGMLGPTGALVQGMMLSTLVLCTGLIIRKHRANGGRASQSSRRDSAA